jgi:hypothetical protein
VAGRSHQGTRRGACVPRRSDGVGAEQPRSRGCLSRPPGPASALLRFSDRRLSPRTRWRRSRGRAPAPVIHIHGVTMGGGTMGGVGMGGIGPGGRGQIGRSSACDHVPPEEPAPDTPLSGGSVDRVTDQDGLARLREPTRPLLLCPFRSRANDRRPRGAGAAGRLSHRQRSAPLPRAGASGASTRVTRLAAGSDRPRPGWSSPVDRLLAPEDGGCRRPVGRARPVWTTESFSVRGRGPTRVPRSRWPTSLAARFVGADRCWCVPGSSGRAPWEVIVR